MDIYSQMCTNAPSYEEGIFYNLFAHIRLSNYTGRFIALKFIRDNDLLSPANKNELFDIFNRYQFIFSTLNSIIRRYKFRKMKRGGCKNDLLGESLDDLAPHLKIMIPHEGLKYLFRVSDLINIINKSLTYREELFLISQYPKNPYTNIHFTKANLLQIYLHIKRNTNLAIPVLFHLFYTTCFNIAEFASKYEAIALDYSLENYIDEFENCDIADLALEWVNTFKQYHKQHYKDLTIHPKYPKNKLIREMRPILKLFLISKHSITASVRFNEFTKANNSMVLFLKNNKTFGQIGHAPVCYQTIFKSLSHLNHYSFNKKREQTIDVIEQFLYGITPEPLHTFTYPNIKPFANKVFILRNYINVASSNSIETIRQRQRNVSRRLEPYNENQLYNALTAANMAEFARNLNSRSTFVAEDTQLNVAEPPTMHVAEYISPLCDDDDDVF